MPTPTDVALVEAAKRISEETTRFRQATSQAQDEFIQTMEKTEDEYGSRAAADSMLFLLLTMSAHDQFTSAARAAIGPLEVLKKAEEARGRD